MQPQAAANASSNGNKLRMLCLHGYLQNAEIFKSRVGSMRKALKAKCDFVFVDAPHVVDAATQAQLAGDDAYVENARTWWRWTDSEPGTRPSRALHYTGWDESVQHLTQALEQHAPVHVIMGFSQGSTAASLLVSQLVAQNSVLLEPLQAAVLVSGFMPHDESFAAQLQQHPPRGLPSLHVYGTRDTLVPNARSQQLAHVWSEGGPLLERPPASSHNGTAAPPFPTYVYVHNGGHMVPTCSGAWKQELLGFLQEVTVRIV